jgi:hypothetical protein
MDRKIDERSATLRNTSVVDLMMEKCPPGRKLQAQLDAGYEEDFGASIDADLPDSSVEDIGSEGEVSISETIEDVVADAMTGDEPATPDDMLEETIDMFADVSEELGIEPAKVVDIVQEIVDSPEAKSELVKAVDEIVEADAAESDSEFAGDVSDDSGSEEDTSSEEDAISEEDEAAITAKRKAERMARRRARHARRIATAAKAPVATAQKKVDDKVSKMKAVVQSMMMENTPKVREKPYK